MQETKKISLAIPTIIVIIIFIILMSYMIYNKNYKYMSKELNRQEALELAQKVAQIDDLSCQVITKKNDKESTTNYKRKGNMVYIETEDNKEYINIETKKCTYIDEENKEAYEYTSDSVIESYNETIYTAIQFLNNNSFSYEFVGDNKINGIKCAEIKLNSDDINVDMFLDRKTGMIVKFIINYKENSDNQENNDVITYIYRYQIGSFGKNSINIPSLDEYTVMNME